MGLKEIKYSKLFRFIHAILFACFISGQVLRPSVALAQSSSILNLPLPGAMVGISPSYIPIAVKGIKVFPDNPFRFDFILDTGNSQLTPQQLNDETKLLIKYFLTALTIPDNDQWVNLSPFENDRIVPNDFGITEMGRDLLAQDYLLKQLTASLVYPEHELGKRFWENVYRKAHEKYGDVDIPVSTFNKVWILPEHAKVYEYGNTAVITESRLRVLLEGDYLALAKNTKDDGRETMDENVPRPSSIVPHGEDVNNLGSQIVREIVLPEIEREVNEGRNFAKLRQIYHSMIMASWYKRKLKDGILGKMYVGANKVAGVDVADKQIKQKIYDQYLAAFKKGVYNYIREDVDVKTQEVIPRKYFSGGVVAGLEVDRTTQVIPVDQQQMASAAGEVAGNSLMVSIGLDPVDQDGKPVRTNFLESDQSAPQKPEGGALKQMGVLGQQQTVEVTNETLTGWQNLPDERKVVKQVEIDGLTSTARVIQLNVDDTPNLSMPAGLFAYHLRDAQGNLIIVLSGDLTTDEIDEALYHEFREDYWERELAARVERGELSDDDQARISWIAHVLASAEESVVFGQDMDAITAYHTRQIRSLENGQLRALINEDRKAHQQVIRRYLTQQQFEKYLEYEERMRAELQKALSARRFVDKLDVEIPVFEGIDRKVFFDPQRRIEQIESIRRSTAAKIKEAFLATGETEGAIAYEIGRLAGAAVDSIVEGLQSSYGDSAKQEAYLSEAKVTFSYERDDMTGKFEVKLSDNGAGMSTEVLNRLRGFYPDSADPQKKFLGESVYDVIQGLIGGAMSYNRWEEVAVVSKTEGDRGAKRFAAGLSGRDTLNDYYATMESGTEITITGRSLAWSTRQERPGLEDDANDVGGIDMNANALDLRTEGQAIQFDMPFDPAKWENIKFDGFTPVILQINTTNLPLFIGANNETDQAIQLSSV